MNVKLSKSPICHNIPTYILDCVSPWFRLLPRGSKLALSTGGLEGEEMMGCPQNGSRMVCGARRPSLPFSAGQAFKEIHGESLSPRLLMHSLSFVMSTLATRLSTI